MPDTRADKFWLIDLEILLQEGDRITWWEPQQGSRLEDTHPITGTIEQLWHCTGDPGPLCPPCTHRRYFRIRVNTILRCVCVHDGFTLMAVDAKNTKETEVVNKVVVV